MERAKRKKCIQLSNENAVFIAKLSILNAIKYDNFVQIEWLNFFLQLRMNVYLFCDNFFPTRRRIMTFFLHHLWCWCREWNHIVIETSIFAQLPIEFWAYLRM